MQLMPSQFGMLLMIHGSHAMVRYASRAEGYARGRQRLIQLTGQDFGYDLLAWHDYLTKTNAGGYKWSNRHRGFPKQIESAIANTQRQHDIEYAVAESLFERLTERDMRQKQALEEAERTWSGKSRSCPKCGTEFKSVGDRGQCIKCAYVFYASHPDLGNVMWWLEIT